MLELRKDYILDRWVIISEKRGKRPKQFKKLESHDVKFCFFCPGNESTTPKEIGRVADKKGDWKIRWFANKFAAVLPKGNPKTSCKGLLCSAAAFGHHEVIVETPDHHKQLADLSISHLTDIFKVYDKRIEDLSNKKNIEYVNVFKNHGRQGGTSLVHTHTQIAATSVVPKEIRDEVDASNKYKRKHKKCAYCEMIKKERKSKRFCFENNTFIAICPYASRFNYEVWVFPKKHIKRMDELKVEQYKDLAEIMKKILKKLSNIGASYNFFLHYAPKGKDLHFHIEVIPRIATWAGFEYCSGIVINSVSPEQAAKFYK